MVWVRLETTVIYFLDLVMVRKPAGQCHSTLAVSIHPELQRFESLAKYPCIEGAHGWATDTHEGSDVCHQIGLSDECAAKDSALSV